MHYYNSLIFFFVTVFTLCAESPFHQKDAGGLLLYIGEPSNEDLKSLSSLTNTNAWNGQILLADSSKLEGLRKKVEEGNKGGLSIRDFNGFNLPVVNNLINRVIDKGLRFPKRS